jgi:hypothetical protein
MKLIPSRYPLSPAIRISHTTSVELLGGMILNPQHPCNKNQALDPQNLENKDVPNG